MSPQLFGFKQPLKWYQRWKRIPCWFGYHPKRVICNVNLGRMPVFSATYCRLCGVELNHKGGL